MRVFIQLLRMSFLNAKEFIIDFFGEILTLPFMLFVISVFWVSITKASPVILEETGMSLKELIMYYICVSSIQYALSPFWYLNYSIYRDINSGKLSIYLARPIDYMEYKICSCIGEIFMRLFITGTCILIISIIIPGINISISSCILFLFVLIEIMAMLFFIQFLIASIAFKTEAIFGIRDVLYEFLHFFGGLIIPISFMPNILRKISMVLPFRFFYSYPAQILLDNNIEFMWIDQIQILIWIFVLGICSRFFFAIGQKNFASNGG